MSKTLETLDTADLSTVTGGFMESINNGLSAIGNFGAGFAGGAIHGVNAKNDDIMMRGLDRNATGTKPGVETGMMFNELAGPVGAGISGIAGMFGGGGTGGGQ